MKNHMNYQWAAFALIGFASLLGTRDGWAAGKKMDRREKIAESKMFKDKDTGTAADMNLSAGIILGAPTGLVVKNEFSADQAVDVGLSYSFNKMFEIYGDWHYRFPGFLNGMGKLPAALRNLEGYAGGGAAILFASGDASNNPVKKEDSATSFGVMLRFPVGVQYRLDNSPLLFFLELVPSFGIVPGTFGAFGAGIGARYYF